MKPWLWALGAALGLAAAFGSTLTLWPSLSPFGLPREPPVELLRVENSGLPCDVERVLMAKCRRCHTEPTRHEAPFALLTWEQIHRERMGEPLYETIEDVIDSDTMVLPLHAHERKVLLGWIERGAPRGSCIEL